MGLARLEFIINRNVGIHPLALIEYDRQPESLKRDIDRRIAAYPPTEYYVAKIAEGVATIAAAFWPKKVIVRLDFKSNEYNNLVGVTATSRTRRTRCAGFRGASRYLAKEFYECLR